MVDSDITFLSVRVTIGALFGDNIDLYKVVSGVVIFTDTLLLVVDMARANRPLVLPAFINSPK